MSRRHLIALSLLAATSLSASANDPLRALLEDSRASGKGVNLYVNGQSIAAVVVSVDDRYLVAKSQALGQIVVRLDRVDGAAGFVGERKSGQ